MEHSKLITLTTQCVSLHRLNSKTSLVTALTHNSVSCSELTKGNLLCNFIPLNYIKISVREHKRPSSSSRVLSNLKHKYYVDDDDDGAKEFKYNYLFVNEKEKSIQAGDDNLLLLMVALHPFPRCTWICGFRGINVRITHFYRFVFSSSWNGWE